MAASTSRRRRLRSRISGPKAFAPPSGSIGTSPAIFTFNWTVAPSGTSWTPAGVDGLLLGAHHSNGSTQASILHWVAAMIDHGGVDVTPTSIAVAYFRAEGVRSAIR